MKMKVSIKKDNPFDSPDPSDDQKETMRKLNVNFRYFDSKIIRLIQLRGSSELIADYLKTTIKGELRLYRDGKIRLFTDHPPSEGRELTIEETKLIIQKDLKLANFK